MSDSFGSTFYSPTPNSTLNSHAPPKTSTFCSISQPYCICTHCNHILTFNHHVGNVAEEGTNSTGSHSVQSQQSTRWSPTPVQLLVLEELYRQGTKTPSAEQIQQIASQLRQFGKIEGKNVFYWFQNHKARERQKRRRREMEENNNNNNASEGLKETGCGVKETKKWASTSNCSGHAEESAALDIAEKGSNGWSQFEERGMQQVLRRNTNTAERQAKLQEIMEMPCFPPIITVPPPPTTTSHLTTTHNTQLLTPQNYNLTSVLNRESLNYYYGEENADPRTLDLFPHNKREDQDGIFLAERKSIFCSTASMDTEITTSNQFFEFLPLRN